MLFGFKNISYFCILWNTTNLWKIKSQFLSKASSQSQCCLSFSDLKLEINLPFTIWTCPVSNRSATVPRSWLRTSKELTYLSTTQVRPVTFPITESLQTDYGIFFNWIFFQFFVVFKSNQKRVKKLFKILKLSLAFEKFT